MDGEFNVFDEWGTYVGKFTPAGGGFDGCLFAIAMLLLWTVGFLVYLLVRLVVQGFRAASRKEWDQAAKYWAVPGLIVAWFVLSLASAAATQAAEERERQLYQEAGQRDQGTLSDTNEAITVERVDGREFLVEGYRGLLYSHYSVTNNLEVTLLDIHLPDGQSAGGYCAGAYLVLEAGQTGEIDCSEYLFFEGFWTRLNPCLRDWKFGSRCLGGLIPPETGSAAIVVDDLTLWFAKWGCGNDPCSGKPKLHARLTISSSLDEKWPLGLRFFLDGKESDRPDILGEDDWPIPPQDDGYWPIFPRPNQSYTLFHRWIDERWAGKEFCIEVSFPYMRSETICREIPSQ